MSEPAAESAPGNSAVAAEQTGKYQSDQLDPNRFVGAHCYVFYES
jgi:hypothetical protein